MSRRPYSHIVQSLQSVREHGAIILIPHVLPDFDCIVGPDSEEIGIESGMVQLAQGKAVRHDRLPARFSIGDDMGRVQKLAMAQPA